MSIAKEVLSFNNVDRYIMKVRIDEDGAEHGALCGYIVRKRLIFCAGWRLEARLLSGRLVAGLAFLFNHDGRLSCYGLELAKIGARGVGAWN